MSIDQKTDSFLGDTCRNNFFDNAYSGDYAQGVSLEDDQRLPRVCYICKEKFTKPVILSCLHVFDKSCLKPYEKMKQNFPTTECPKCGCVSDVINNLVPFHSQLVTDEVIGADIDCFSIERPESNSKVTAKCSLCTDNSDAISKCLDCPGTLCATCLGVHKRMKMFSTHNVMDLTDDEKYNPKELTRKMAQLKPVECSTHRDNSYNHFCFQCNLPLCDECLRLDHYNHVTSLLEPATERVHSYVSTLVNDCSKNRTNLCMTADKLQTMITELQQSREQNQGHIEEVCNDWKIALDEIKEEFMKKNRTIHNELEISLLTNIELAQSRIDHMDYVQKFTSHYLPRLSPVEYARICKSVLSCLEGLCKFELSHKSAVTRVPFVDDKVGIHEVLRRHYGWFGQREVNCTSSTFGNTDSLPLGGTSSNMGYMMGNNANRILSGMENIDLNGLDGTNGMIPSSVMPSGDELSAQSIGLPNNGMRSLRRLMSPQNGFSSAVGSNSHFSANSMQVSSDINHTLLGIDFDVDSTIATGLASLPGIGDVNLNGAGGTMADTNYSHATSSGGSQMSSVIRSRTDTPGGTSGNMFSNTAVDDLNNLPGGSLFSMQHSLTGGPPLSGLAQQSIAKPGIVTGYNPNPNPPFPNRQGRCQAMNVKNRWGSLGPSPEQMNSPHGFCLGFDEDIVVADTQNHRILVFSKDGYPRTHFGIAGREEGQLWYPRKVTILRATQKYIVCDRGSERSRMQVFTRNGHFLKKINIRYIDIVAGLAINSEGNIVAVDSVSPSVFIITEQGELVRWFDCSEYMREPSDIAINQNEYFVCDFKGHCVAVFTDKGTFLRRIGSDAITNFPNGIDVSDYGDVLIGDSHGNRFHVAVFDRTGESRGEFECPNLKVSRCCGLKITSEGYLVTLAKNNNQVIIIDTLYVN